uniref:Uncharacterized protein n=1 Tax=Anopheles quadriannulatus TaxID=34691 RepID=A0A182XLN7_ANOQN
MPGTWLSSLGVFCLLLCFVSGEPRPDFALNSTLIGTVRVSGAIDDTQLVVADINANLYINLNSTYPGLSALLKLTQEVGETASRLLYNVLTPLESLAPSRDSQDVQLFDDVLKNITTLQKFVSVRLVAISTDIEMKLNGFLPSKLEDVFGRVVLGLQELGLALETLKSAVTAVLSKGSQGECPPKSVRPKLVYRVVYAVRTLRAYLPAVTYTLTTVVENIALADRFIVRLSEDTKQVQDPNQYVDLVRATTGMVSRAVATSIATVTAEYGKVSAKLPQFANLTTLMAYGQVGQLMNSFNAVLMQLGTIDASFDASLADIAEKLRLTLQPDESTPMVDNAEVVATLVTTLISSSPYGRFCFYKFSELLLGLTDTGLLGVEGCISRETLRLHQLSYALQEQARLLLFDLKDLPTELGECNLLPNANRRAACVTTVSVVGFYTSVAKSFRIKFNNLYSTGSAEADASKHRLAACVKVLQFKLVDGSSTDLNAQIRKCSMVGPVPEE